jgi:hypothetical protein
MFVESEMFSSAIGRISFFIKNFKKKLIKFGLFKKKFYFRVVV